MLEKEAYEKGSKTRRQHRGLPQTMDAKERRTVGRRTQATRPDGPIQPSEPTTWRSRQGSRPHQDRSRLHNVLRGHAHRTTSQSKGNQNARQGQPRPPSDSRQMRRRHHTKDEVLHTSAYTSQPARAQDLTASLPHPEQVISGPLEVTPPQSLPIPDQRVQREPALSRRKGELPEGIRRCIISVLYKMKDRDEPTTHATIDPSH